MSGLRERPPRPAAPHTWAPAMQRTRCGGLGATGPSLGAREPPGRRLGPRGAGPLRQEPPPGPGPGPSDGRLVGLINAAGRGGVTAVNKQIGKPQARGSAAPAARAVWSGSFHDPSAPRRRRALFLTPGDACVQGAGLARAPRPRPRAPPACHQGPSRRPLLPLAPASRNPPTSSRGRRSTRFINSLRGS